MSDGPHRSLPMKRHWKDLAERAATPAFSAGEVADCVPVALRQDFRETPLLKVRDIFGGGEQSSLFSEDRAGQIEAARRACRGSAAGTALIDSALEANADGLAGDAAFKAALQTALAAHARAVCHQIEEHYLREEPQNTARVRDRLAAARKRCDFGGLASEMMSGGPTDKESLRLRKRKGIDEGPPL